MAAYAAIASLLNNIEQIMKHPLLSTSLDKNQIQLLHEKAGFLLDFIECYSYGGVMREEVEDMERHIASAAHAAEDVIESHIVDQIHAGSSEASLGCTLSLQQIIQDMDVIMEKAEELKKKEGLREEQLMHSRPLMETGETVDMVGFEDDVIQLLDELTSDQSSRHLISIVGMGGTGKTTLAHNLYQNLHINQHFDIRAWATISQQHSAKEILSQLLSDHGKYLGRSVDDLGLVLHKSLWGRRYLIILDNIWSVEAWDEVRRFFPDDENRSRVVLTTRLANVARDCLSNSCITMKPLEEHESWKLLCKKAFQQELCPYPELSQVGKEIARLCRGLPLSNVVVGGLLLNSPRSVEFWEGVLRNIKSVSNSKEKQESLDILSLSYNHLPPHLKPCFLYMGFFREDSQIRVSDIIQLWIAEGFLRPKNTNILEEVAEHYLKELIDRNLILVGKRRNNGKVGSCSIHDLVRDLCLKLGGQQEFIHTNEVQGTVRRLISHENQPPIRGELSLVRSIFTGSYIWEPPKHKLLRILDEGHHDFQSKIIGNVNLRYLAFYSEFYEQTLREVPSSVTLIWNLQTLKIRQRWFDRLVFAPAELWKMRQLRHVKCSKIYLPSDGLFMMDNLRTLTTAVNLRLSEEVCKFIPNIKKLYLLYHHDLHGYDDSLIECVRSLDCLHQLETLNLSIKCSRRLIIESEVNKKLAFPTCLNKLSLSGCLLGWEDLQMIGSLPQLEVLELGISCVMVGNKWSSVDEQFVRLKYLKIDWCNLHYWEADNSHFPVLEKLILSGLKHLIEIPWGIGEIPTLELIRTEYCSESAAISAVKIKEDYLENQGTDDLQIQVRISSSQVESFVEKLVENGLPLNHIRLEY